MFSTEIVVDSRPIDWLQQWRKQHVYLNIVYIHFSHTADENPNHDVINYERKTFQQC